MVLVLELVFWCSLAAVVAVAIGYPVFLYCTASIVRARVVDESLEPTVSLIIAAYNEEAVIRGKLENSLLLDYPRSKLEIIVASDGSSDQTNPIVGEYAARGIGLAAFPRTGKTGVQNRMAQSATGDILVFSDANAMYRPDAIRKLVRNFADPAVGGVCGQLTYSDDGKDAGAGASETAYWNYEQFIKRRESELSSVVGANGSIYAVRRTSYVAIPEDLISDFVEPLAIVLSGKRVIYERDAISVESASTNYASEFRRKVRILTRSIRGLLSMRSLMNPLRYGIFSVQLVMHKFLRFVTPLFIITGALALTGLAALGYYRWLFALSAVTVIAAVAVASRERVGRVSIVRRALNLLYYYLMANAALVLAWVKVVRGQKMVLWVPERGKQ